ncbi:ribosome-recycling factor [Bacteroidetes bacterium UKL13-3]|jgi:ribosome recycling factor|nr:ribosome-recycling factor [Bacteroidetes bacterium UKL13-3]HCP93056.1 ribosome recycling factor [Bacteroidota bacterium]
MSDPRVKAVFDDMKVAMDKAIDHAANEFTKIRAGKSHPSMLDSVKVEYYGEMVPLSQVGNITTPDARSITVQPWEKSVLQAIEKGIVIANLGFTPSNDGSIIRITLPMLTEDRRKEIVKKVKAEAESAKVAVRNIRKDVNETIKRLQKDGLPEDEAKAAETQVQKNTDVYIKKIEDLTATKEAEVMHV